MIARAVVTACEGKTVKIGLLAGESREDVDFFQQYGFSSRPKGSVGAVALFVGGSRDNGVVVACRGEGDDMNIGLENGEVAMHSPFGQKILLKKDGSVNITNGNGASIVIASSGKVTVNDHLEVSL